MLGMTLCGTHSDSACAPPIAAAGESGVRYSHLQKMQRPAYDHLAAEPRDQGPRTGGRGSDESQSDVLLLSTQNTATPRQYSHVSSLEGTCAAYDHLGSREGTGVEYNHLAGDTVRLVGVKHSMFQSSLVHSAVRGRWRCCLWLVRSAHCEWA